MPAMTKEEFIIDYIHREVSVGFRIVQTPDGCAYLDDPTNGVKGIVMIALPCDCGRCNGWGMEPTGA
jgi:hypothetical protein